MTRDETCGIARSATENDQKPIMQLKEFHISKKIRFTTANFKREQGKSGNLLKYDSTLRQSLELLNAYPRHTTPPVTYTDSSPRRELTKDETDLALWRRKNRIKLNPKDAKRFK